MAHRMPSLYLIEDETWSRLDAIAKLRPGTGDNSQLVVLFRFGLRWCHWLEGKYPLHAAFSGASLEVPSKLARSRVCEKTRAMLNLQIARHTSMRSLNHTNHPEDMTLSTTIKYYQLNTDSIRNISNLNIISI